MSPLDTHAGFFRLLMKGIFDPHVHTYKDFPAFGVALSALKVFTYIRICTALSALLPFDFLISNVC